ncbi:MAG: hypothetical protein ABSE68_01155 [Minisyncoccia bacterium]
MSTKNTFIVVGVLVLIAVATLLVIVFAGGQAKPNPAIDVFAACLRDKKVTMYGAYSCVHCQNQKKLFGSSFQYVPYVECTQETARCTAAGIEGLPTWVLADGTKLLGEQSFEDLSKASGCPLPTSTVQ